LIYSFELVLNREFGTSGGVGTIFDISYSTSISSNVGGVGLFAGVIVSKEGIGLQFFDGASWTYQTVSSSYSMKSPSKTKLFKSFFFADGASLCSQRYSSGMLQSLTWAESSWGVNWHVGSVGAVAESYRGFLFL
jgi:hypothetical protein